MSGQPGYQRGDRIALEHTTDPHTRLRPGDEGTVTSYDPRLGQLNIRWDSGSTLAMLLHDGDQVRLITPPQASLPARTGPPAPAREHPAPTVTRSSGRPGTPATPSPAAPAASIASDAENLGRDAGKAAASWMFDGNTPEDTYRAVLRGIEDGDPVILDAYPAPGLSAGGGYTEADLARDLGLDGEDQLLPDAATAYLDAAAESFWHETERLACQHLAANTTDARPADTGKEHSR